MLWERIPWHVHVKTNFFVNVYLFVSQWDPILVKKFNDNVYTYWIKDIYLYT